MVAKRSATGLLLAILSATAAMFAGPAGSEPAAVYTQVKLNVVDVQRSVDFYTRVLGFHEHHRTDSAKGTVEVVLNPIGGDRDFQPGITLHSAGTSRLELGTALNNVLVAVIDLDVVMAAAAKSGAEIVKDVVESPVLARSSKR